ncbi:hypothetical protein M0K88_004851 [Escherichia coli]|nr:hypothetical protein [Escherichia coli]
MKNPRFGTAQEGFTIAGFLVVLALVTLAGIYQTRQWIASANDDQAVATGRYMLTVRGAVIDALSRYQAALSLTDTSGAPTGIYPTPPAWATFTGDSQTVQLKDLKDAGLLSKDFPDSPPFGRSVFVRLLRAPGTCPGVGCEVRAFVVSCWPIASGVKITTLDPSNCPSAPSNLEYSQNLVAKVMSGADGYGGSNLIDPSRLRGTLFNEAATDLGIPAGSRGHVVVVASLNATPFNGFVRQGDIREVWLNNTLSVAGRISTDKGLLIKTEVQVGDACTDESMYATTNRQSWAQCLDGQWFELTNHVVMSTQYLANGASVVAPICPGTSMEPFTYASMQRSDVTMTGTDVNVRGDMNGTITGAGVVNQTGNVSVSGTYNGKVVSSPDSSIRVAQGVEILSGQVVITPPGPNARAMVIQGCRYRG